MIQLDAWDLGLAALLVLLLGLFTWLLELRLFRSLAVAASRTVIQLLLVGLVLKLLFASAAPGWVLLMATVMLLVAGREVMARQQHAFRAAWGYSLGLASMFVSSFAVAIFSLTVVVQPEPWYQPQYSIPLLGMLLGNTMNGVALSLDRLTHAAIQHRGIIEARLALGQDWNQAIAGYRRDSVRVGLIPMINAMAAAGVVSLPGMMTGQILAGAPPVEAVQYQILIMFMITVGTGFGTIGATWLGSRRLFDERERLRLDRLRHTD